MLTTLGKMELSKLPRHLEIILHLNKIKILNRLCSSIGASIALTLNKFFRGNYDSANKLLQQQVASVMCVRT